MIIADENIPSSIIELLIANNFKITSVFEDYRGISDVDIINLASLNNQIILTEDKDFGDLVFAYNKLCSVILLRYHFSNLEEMSSRLLEYLKLNRENTSIFTVITLENIRERKIVN